jgi:hypothetical protein
VGGALSASGSHRSDIKFSCWSAELSHPALSNDQSLIEFMMRKNVFNHPRLELVVVALTVESFL